MNTNLLKNSIRIKNLTSKNIKKEFLLRASDTFLSIVNSVKSGDINLNCSKAVINKIDFLEVFITKDKKSNKICADILLSQNRGQFNFFVNSDYLMARENNSNKIYKDFKNYLINGDLKIKRVEKKRKRLVAKRRINRINRNIPKVLFFKNILNSPDKERDSSWYHMGTLYIISALKYCRNRNISVIMSDSKISLDEGKFITEQDELEHILKNNPDINFIGITLFESYFEKVASLVKFIRKHSKAFIAVGGIMSSLAPKHVFVHLPEVNFIIRGQGEKIVTEIIDVLGAANIDSVLSREQEDKLNTLEGMLFFNCNTLISSNLDKLNLINNYDESKIDFSVVERNDVRNGINLYTSYGCNYSCYFCTTLFKNKFNSKSLENIDYILNDYKSTLIKLFGSFKNIPALAFGLSFYDDDFLGDAKRAIGFFRYIRNSPFHINFFQTGINSFFIRDKRKRINSKLLNSILPNLFKPKINIDELHLSGPIQDRTWIYIGTENFCDEELDRLGKGYKFQDISVVVNELSKKQIYQAHHMILANTHTSLDNIIDNLIKISKLKRAYGEYFNILHPVTSNLVSLFPSVSYRKIINSNLQNNLKVRKRLKINFYPEFDYPLIDKDIPRDGIVSKIADNSNLMFQKDRYYLNIFQNLLNFLNKLPEVRKQKNKNHIDKIIAGLKQAL